MFLSVACKATPQHITASTTPQKPQTTVPKATVNAVLNTQLKCMEVDVWVPYDEPGISTAVWHERMQILEGFLLGFDSLKRKGIPFRVRINPNDSTANNESLTLKFEREAFRIQYPPLNIDFETRPIMPMHVRQVNRMVKKEGAVMLVLSSGASLDKAVVDALKEEGASFKLLEKKSPEKDELIQRLHKQKPNLIYIVSPDELFVGRVLRELQSVKTMFDIQIVGLPNWSNFPAISAELFADFNVLLTSATTVDRQQADFVRFRQSFVDSFYAEPADLAVQAFDHIMLLSQCWDAEAGWQKATFKEAHHLPTFDLKLVNKDDQWLNQAVRLLRFEDYTFKPITHASGN